MALATPKITSSFHQLMKRSNDPAIIEDLRTSDSFLVLGGRAFEAMDWKYLRLLIKSHRVLQ